MEALIESLLSEGRGIAAGYVAGFYWLERGESTPTATDQSAIGRARLAGYQARALYLPSIEHVERLARNWAANNHD